MASSNLPPSAAKDAVLVKSVEMPEDAQKVEELDFNQFRGRPITADDLFQGMKHMGFQASSMCEAIRIINEMVRSGQRPPSRSGAGYGQHHHHHRDAAPRALAVHALTSESSEHGETPRRGPAPPSSWATRPT